MPTATATTPVPAANSNIGRLLKNGDLLLTGGLFGTLLLMIVPVAPFLLDGLLAISIAISLLILLVILYVKEPADFTGFPTLLLFVTLFRLALNIATTRLILIDGYAGHIIQAFGDFVVRGNYVVGFVVFAILVIINFIVITKGAGRIAEVAARFTLDAMPGKQMAIDAELNAGVINEAEARSRRKRVEQEADFYGAMDGASKFVRGDAIAAILITLINIVGGFAIGTLQKGWAAGETAQAFTILTIGDGIASQVPSFVIAIAAALIVTRASAKDTLGEEISAQLSGRPGTMFITAIFIAMLALTPLPAPPLLALALIMAGIGWFTLQEQRASKRAVQQAEADEKSGASQPTPPVEDLLKVDTLELEIGYALVSLVDTNQGGDLLERIAAIRRQLAAEIGLVIPPVRIRDNMTLPPEHYRIKIRANVVAEGETRANMLLAMDSGIASGPIEGEQTREPAFGLDAWWIAPSLKTRAETMNYTVVDPTSVLTTHMAELARTHADELLTREEVNNLIEQLKKHAPRLVEQTIPDTVSPGDLQKVMQALLRERVPVRDLETIVEVLAEWAKKTKDIDVLVEYVRNGLRRSICSQHIVPPDPANGYSKPRIVCVTLDPGFEDALSAYIDRTGGGTTVSVPASTANLMARCVVDALRAVTQAGHAPIVIASPAVRAPVRQLLEPYLPNVAVLGYNEIVSGVEVESLGLVSLPEEPSVAGAA